MEQTSAHCRSTTSVFPETATTGRSTPRLEKGTTIVDVDGNDEDAAVTLYTLLHLLEHKWDTPETKLTQLPPSLSGHLRVKIDKIVQNMGKCKDRISKSANHEAERLISSSTRRQSIVNLRIQLDKMCATALSIEQSVDDEDNAVINTGDSCDTDSTHGSIHNMDARGGGSSQNIGTTSSSKGHSTRGTLQPRPTRGSAERSKRAREEVYDQLTSQAEELFESAKKLRKLEPERRSYGVARAELGTSSNSSTATATATATSSDLSTMIFTSSGSGGGHSNGCKNRLGIEKHVNGRAESVPKIKR